MCSRAHERPTSTGLSAAYACVAQPAHGFALCFPL